ncbi:MAG TPA: YiaA/YiaB family inner membrane protein [Trichocoleus sp.]
MANLNPPRSHSSVWIVQSWASFVLSIAGLTLGIVNLPVDSWIKGYMGIGTVFVVGSTLTLAKTTRDLHEEKQLTARIDEARVERLLADHHPLK